MNKLELTICLGAYPYTNPILDGRVKSNRIEWHIKQYPSLPLAFREMIRSDEVDVGEMAIVTHILAHRFAKPLTALAIPLWSRLPHTNLVCPDNNSDFGPADLHGTVLGVRSYAQTSGVWVRGVLADEYGVDHRKISWRTFEDAHVAEYVDPPFASPDQSGATLRDQMLSGELSAIMGERIVDQSDIRMVIPDAENAAHDWMARTGIFPINHVLSVKSELVKQHPWLAAELMDIFGRARDIAEAEGHPVPPAYGLETHYASLAKVLQYSADQDITERLYQPEELLQPV